MYEYRAKVIKVIDGDTIDVDIDLGFGVILAKQRIRLYGIDTPESRTSDKVEKFYGKISSAFMGAAAQGVAMLKLWDYISLLIVVGGSLAATCIAYPLSDVLDSGVSIP